MEKVLFDLDDTLVNHSQAEITAAGEFGNLFAEEIPDYDRETFELIWREASIRHIKDFLAHKIDFTEQRIRRIRDVFQNQSMAAEESLEYFSRYLRMYEDSWTLFPDVPETLEYMKKMNIEMGVVTDGAQEQQELKLERTGILPYFQFVLTAESEGTAKPDPGFFKKGAERFGADPNDVLYIGDNLEKDAIGASDAGLVGIWLNRNRTDGSFSRTVTDLRELKDLIRSGNITEY